MSIFQAKLLIPVASAALIGAGVYGVSQASASTSPNSPHASLIQELANTFHVDQSKVQAVFDQHRAENQQKRETNYEDHLTQAVTDGELTSAQKAAILTEHNQLQTEQQAAMSQTGSGRRTAMQKIREEAKTWATQNNIDVKWLLGPRPLRGRMMAQPPAADPAL